MLILSDIDTLLNSRVFYNFSFMFIKEFFGLVGLATGFVFAQPLYAGSDQTTSGLPDLIDRKLGLTDLIGDNSRFNLDFSVRGIYTDVDQEWAGEAFFGIDILKTFTSADGDWGSLNLQFYLTQLMDQPNRGSFFEEDHDLKLVTRITSFNYTGLADGKLNFKVGHFEIPYGLEVPINTNGTLRQLNTGSNIGVKADWGVGINGVLPRFQYELTYTKATGQDIKLSVDTYIVAGRIGTPTDGESFSGVPAVGLSFFYGELDTPGGLVDRTRFGFDAAQYFGPFTLMGELSVGSDNGDDIANAFVELNLINRDETLVYYTQLKSLNKEIADDWKDAWSSALGLRYIPDNHWALSAQVAQQWDTFTANEARTIFSLQSRYRF